MEAEAAVALKRVQDLEGEMERIDAEIATLEAGGSTETGSAETEAPTEQTEGHEPTIEDLNGDIKALFGQIMEHTKYIEKTPLAKIENADTRLDGAKKTRNEILKKVNQLAETLIKSGLPDEAGKTINKFINSRIIDKIDRAIDNYASKINDKKDVDGPQKQGEYTTDEVEQVVKFLDLQMSAKKSLDKRLEPDDLNKLKLANLVDSRSGQLGNMINMDRLSSEAIDIVKQQRKELLTAMYGEIARAGDLDKLSSAEGAEQVFFLLNIPKNEADNITSLNRYIKNAEKEAQKRAG